MYKPLEEAGWERREINVVSSAAGRTGKSGLQGKGDSKEKQKRVECIWINPVAQEK